MIPQRLQQRFIAKLYQEPKSTIKSNANYYDLNIIFKAVEHQPVEHIALSELLWILKHIDPLDPERVQRSDVSVPILVTQYRNKELAIDGLHRLVKASQLHMRTIPYKRVSKEVFESALVSESKRQLAVIIKGNPKYINNAIAKKYYSDIKTYLEGKGYIVEFDAGDDYTRPRLDADIYIAHSRGCSRYEFMPKDKQKVFLKFGVPDGIIHPVDLKWVTEKWYPGTNEQPPKEHFIFLKQQKQAIDALIRVIKAGTNVATEHHVPLYTQW